MANSHNSGTLRRTLTLPLLVVYGVGVTIGAGIFALIGEVLRTAGDHAPLAFLVAGLIAGATGWSYAKLSAVYPRAGGEAVYAKIGFGGTLAQLVGYGVVATGIISSAVIALAFGNYLSALLPLPPAVLVVLVVCSLAGIACMGVKESVLFAAVVTALEVGTLLWVAYFGAPSVFDVGVINRLTLLPQDAAIWGTVFSGALLAFFAFIGFEDIVNMAEETRDAERVVPLAIVITLAITVLIYVFVAAIAAAVPARDAITTSHAPMTALFETVSGRAGDTVTAMASVSLINGILVQIVMASRVLHGMARENLAPQAIGVIHPKRQTPVRAIVLVGLIILSLALLLPLAHLAATTSFVTLTVFTLVNLSLWRIGSAVDAVPSLHRWRYWGLGSALLCVLLLFANVV